MKTEEIKWVCTPQCRLCIPDEKMKRRFQCIGCTKRPREEKPPVRKNRKLRKASQDKRDFKIAALRAKGLSFTEISSITGVPRSTVFNAVKRIKKRDCNSNSTFVCDGRLKNPFDSQF